MDEETDGMASIKDFFEKFLAFKTLSQMLVTLISVLSCTGKDL